MALDHCELKQAAWSHSVWNGGAIRSSRLVGASFDQARLRRVQTREADLEQAMFDGARLEDCAFEQLNAPRLSLRQARLGAGQPVRRQSARTGRQRRRAAVGEVVRLRLPRGPAGRPAARRMERGRHRRRAVRR
ncbi:pentapeptide repeat-containing protein [Chromobacterium haemolyticum]|nr:pentapeptide repeat-containing protein [Chromobacterium haemolyticum]